MIVPFVDYGELQNAIENNLKINGLQPVETFINKIIQGALLCGVSSNLFVLDTYINILFIGYTLFFSFSFFSFFFFYYTVHETMLVRHGMMLVGETGSGKTTNLKTLSSALCDLHQRNICDPDGFFRPVDSFILNPKSVSVDELYGKFNLLTQEWKNGIVATL